MLIAYIRTVLYHQVHVAAAGVEPGYLERISLRERCEIGHQEAANAYAITHLAGSVRRQGS